MGRRSHQPEKRTEAALSAIAPAAKLQVVTTTMQSDTAPPSLACNLGQLSSTLPVPDNVTDLRTVSGIVENLHVPAAYSRLGRSESDGELQDSPAGLLYYTRLPNCEVRP